MAIGVSVENLKHGAGDLLAKFGTAVFGPTIPDWARGEGGQALKEDVNLINYALRRVLSETGVTNDSEEFAMIGPDRNRFAVIRRDLASESISSFDINIYLEGLFQLSPDEQPVRGSVVLPSLYQSDKPPSFLVTEPFRNPVPRKVDVRSMVGGLKRYLGDSRAFNITSFEVNHYLLGRYQDMQTTIPLYPQP